MFLADARVIAEDEVDDEVPPRLNHPPPISGNIGIAAEAKRPSPDTEVMTVSGELVLPVESVPKFSELMESTLDDIAPGNERGGS